MHLRLRARIAQLDCGLLLAVLLSLAAAWPFLLRSSLPRETDAELHVFRAAELGYSLRALDLYPRWAPDFYYGYGYPIFNYYAPLTYYLANIFSLFIPGGAVFGTKAVFVAGFVLAGVGTYLLARQFTSSRGALIAAVSYLFSPYFYLIDSHMRGDLAEFFALGLAPMALWAVIAYQRDSSGKRLIVASLLPAALILSHNLLGLIFFALLTGQTLWIWLCITQKPMRIWILGGFKQALPLILAVCLAAFFWLPVALENQAVQLHNLIGPGHFDFREHFMSTTELFAPSLPLDLGSVNPAFRFNLGLAQWIIGLVGVVGLLIAFMGKTEANTASYSLPPQAGLFWLISSIYLILLMLRISLPIWETVPIMPFFQFPWRMLGPAGLCVAILGGYSINLLTYIPLKLRSSALSAAVALVILSTLPIWSPPNWNGFGATDQVAMLEFELGGFALGTTSTGDFVPSTVSVVPDPSQQVVDSYRAGDTIDRVDYASLPANASIRLVRQHPASDEYEISSEEAFTLRLYRFMFPGWKATVDGNLVEVGATEPEGFILVPVAAGDHEVRVWLGLTTPRIAASGLSIAALLVLLILSYRMQPKSAGQHSSEEELSLSDFRFAAAGIAAAFVIAFLGSIAGLWQPKSQGITAVPAERSAHHYLESGIDFIGYDLPDQPLRPGDEVPITIYWKAREPIPGNYQVFVHLTTVPEHIWAQSDKLNPGDYPTTRWPTDKYVRDPHSFSIPLGTPPGEYQIRVGIWDRNTGRRLLLLEQDGTILGDAIALDDPIEILPTNIQPSTAALPLDVTTQVEVASGLTLLGADLDPDGAFTAELGHLAIRLYWQSSASNLPDYEVAIRLIAADGTIVTTTQERFTDGLLPTTKLIPGSIVRDIHTLWIDSSISAGNYTIEIGLAEIKQPNEFDWITLTTISRQ